MPAFQVLSVNEWTAHDPFGALKEVDRSAAPERQGPGGAIRLQAARGGYVSFRLLVIGAGSYRCSAAIGAELEIECFKAWYHRMDKDDEAPSYLPDALLPLPAEASFQIPDPDNAIPGQTVQELWIDIYVPGEAAVGVVSGAVAVKSGGASQELAVSIEVQESVLPEESCVEIDGNSYGCGLLYNQYSKTFGGKEPRDEAGWGKAIELLQHQYRIAREHRVTFHNLNHRQSGYTEPIYAPRVEGRGHERNITDWTLFDRLYGPLLDGSAFASAAPGAPRPRRPATPLAGVYTPFNPLWPASYVAWGEPGYEVEMTRCLGQFDEHFRQKGWNRTRLEFFQNHKKRYRNFEWDGDEARFRKDHGHHLEMIRLMRKVSDSSPLQWAYRIDASWQMEREFEILRGEPTMWVCGRMIRWFPERVSELIGRGDIAWGYGGTHPVKMPSSFILQILYTTWARGLQGYCTWLANNPGNEPWHGRGFNGGTGWWYPGEAFGIDGPIPSIRLKILRNGVQDIDLLDQQAREQGTLDELRARFTRQVHIPLWEKRPAASRVLPPEDWDQSKPGFAHEPDAEAEPLDPLWWTEIRENVCASGVSA